MDEPAAVLAVGHVGPHRIERLFLVQERALERIVVTGGQITDSRVVGPSLAEPCSDARNRCDVPSP